MTSRRLASLGGLALAAADRSHGRQAPLLDLWRLSTPQIHPTKLASKRDLSILSRTSPSPWCTVRAHASPSRALLGCAMLLLAAPPPELCWWLTWRRCWCWDQGRRNLRPHLHPRRSRCAPLRSLRRPRRPAGPACPRETVFGLCGCTGAGLALTGAAEPPASLRMALL